MSDALREIAERFASDIGGWTSDDGKQTTRPHEMTVLHDDGLYRHLRFRSPDYGFYWFDLITWPGSLTVNGDCGTYTFSRVEDMFGFFRSDRGINPGYWAEKIRGDTRTKSYSEERFRQQVAEAVAEAEKNCPGVREAIEGEFYGVMSEWDVSHEDGARRALEEFRFYRNEEDRYDHRKQPDFLFVDTWEWDLGDWDWQFLWCCHAIQWGIRQYDAGAQREVTVATTGGVL